MMVFFALYLISLSLFVFTTTAGCQPSPSAVISGTNTISKTALPVMMCEGKGDERQQQNQHQLLLRRHQNNEITSILTNSIAVINENNNNNNNHANNNASSNSKQLQQAVWLYTDYYSNDTKSSNLNDSTIDNLLARNVNTIYFSAPMDEGWKNASIASKYIGFINDARLKDIKVYGVIMQDPKYIFETEAELRQAFGDFVRATQGIFDTFITDIEPHTLPGPDPNVFLPQYIKMSSILADIAKQYHAKYIDTVPAWYHQAIKDLGISPGLNSLSSNSIVLMDYTYNTERTLQNIDQIRSDVTKPYIVSIKIAPGQGDPQLMHSEINKTICTLRTYSLPVVVYDVQYLIKQDPKLFQGC
jgi:hypothetical protein